MSEKYQILARKYRPQTFEEVVAQTSIVKTIKNAIRFKKTAHAYLFSGTRGTGKTTLARLFAKALNCKNLTANYEPCNACQSCKEISASRSLDVIEIDGASNRGIDDIRQINDTISYSPCGNYKIYIIDEVHMLTKEAFNALLKTLEEPPENIKFFFATTEAHKVLPTIVSRCQRFELKRISNDLIIEKLKKISIDLKREIEKDALYQIANFSEGSLRDAESLLDQIFCYSEGKITLDYINQALGFINLDYFFELDKKIFENDIYFAFEFANQIHTSGKDLSYFVEELTTHFKNLLILKLNEKNGLNFLSDNLRKKYLKSTINYSQEQLFYILDLLTTAISANKNTFKKIHLESLLLKIIKSKNIITVDILVKRLIELEEKIKSLIFSEKPRSEKQSTTNPTTFKNEQPKDKTNIQYKKINFSLTKTKDIKVINPKEQSHYDTLLKFTQVEFDAINKD